MAERRFLLFRDDFAELLKFLLDDGCAIALSEQRKVPEVRHLKSDCIEEAFAGSSVQLLAKHRSFATDEFASQSVNNIHSGHIFMMSSIRGDGHIDILAFRAPADERCHRVSVHYGSFFTPADGGNIGPSPELKAYYHKVISFLNRRTDKLAGIPYRVSRQARSNTISPEVWKWMF